MFPTPSSSRSGLRCSALVAFLALGLAEAAAAQPSFTKAFSPAEIGPGSASRLTFTIQNDSIIGATDLAFTDVLPAGLTLTTPSQVESDCGGTVSAPDGGGTIALANGIIGGSSSCTISVLVTGGTTATSYDNVSGDLTSSAGNSGPASAGLTIATDRPGFTKSFGSPSPQFGQRSASSIQLGERTTLTFLIDNSANASIAALFGFTDSLPSGSVVADPPNVASDCGAVTAPAGGTTVTLASGGVVGAGSTCSVAVDVIGVGAGVQVNVSSDLTSTPGFGTFSSGLAVAGLDLSVDDHSPSKSFTDDPVPAGGTVTLEFTVANRDRLQSATGITFTDDLDASLSGLAATGLPANDVCGAGSTLTGMGLLTLTGGNLPPGGTCTFGVTLQVPASAAAGAYLNTTSAISADVGGSPVAGSAASEFLYVAPIPILTKEFLGDPIGAGNTVTLRFTVDNTSQSSAATDIAFQDELTTFLPFPVSVGTLPADPCGSGSSIALVTVPTERQELQLTGGNLDAAGSCTFDVDVDLPAGLPGAVYTNTTSAITATVDAETVTGTPATDDLIVVAAPQLLKEFIDDPVAPGGTATLQFTLLYGPEAAADATSIAFDDDLNAALAGLSALGTPLDDVCGVGSQLAGSTNLSLTGGTLSPGGSCQFSVQVQVPMSALPGAHTNTTTPVTAVVLGEAATGAAATDDLRVAGLELAKSFTDDPVIAGEAATLEFTVTNTSMFSDATSISFTDTVNASLSSLTVDPGSVPTDPCGAGSTLGLIGQTLSLSGGNLVAGASCTFSVLVNVQAGTASGRYTNVTSSMTATLESTTIVFDGAADDLEVDSTTLALSKSFTDDPVRPGGVVNLRFTLTNLDAARTATGVAFSDDLNAALAGLAATSLPANDFCGAGSQATGSGVIDVTGASLDPSASCVFDVGVTVPAGVPLGAIVTNTTTGVTGTLDGLAVVGDPASDVLRISFLSFSKSFGGATAAGGTPTLSFTIDNVSAGETVTGLEFIDDLDPVLSGLVATGLPLTNVCGGGSRIEGTGRLLFSGGSLGPGATCSFGVPLQVPGAAAPGTYTNTTSDLLIAGQGVTDPATADLVVEPPPLFSKSFAPGSIDVGDPATLTFTIDNSASSLDASSLDFTDNLPAGMEVDATPNASTTCTGGTLTATAGSGVVSYTGGTVGAGASCTVSVDVTGTSPGALLNTSGDLTSSSGNSGTAADTLTVNDVTPPQVTSVNSVLDTGDGVLDECEDARVAITQLLVTFDDPMNDPAGNGDVDDVTNPANYLLVRAGPDLDFSTLGCGPAQGDDVAVVIGGVSYDDPTRTATLSVNGGLPLRDELHRLFACSELVDAAGSNALDGDGDGNGGDDFSRDFRVDRANLLANGNFDCDLGSWALTSGLPAEIVYDALDSGGSSRSGSARVTNLSGGTLFAATQCVDTTLAGAALSGQLRVETTGVVATLLCRLYDAPSCGGALLRTIAVGSLSADKGGATGVWQSFSGDVPLDSSVRSVRCGAELVSSAGSAFDARVDDVTLTAVPALRIFRAERPADDGGRGGARGRAAGSRHTGGAPPRE